MFVSGVQVCDTFGPHDVGPEVADLVVAEGAVEGDKAGDDPGRLEGEDSNGGGRRGRGWVFVVVEKELAEGMAGAGEPLH